LAVTSPTSSLDASPFTGGRDKARMFRRASRHSRLVRLLRVVLPVMLVLSLGVLALATWLNPLRLLAVRLPADINGLVISGTKITMAQPKLSGYTRDGRWYEVTAQAAAQDITKPDVFELQEMRAKLETEDKNTLHLTATDGVFDRKSGILTLGRQIVLHSTNGTEVRLSEAVIDTASGDIVSNKPVEVKMLHGTLTGSKLEVVKAGEVIRLDGGVLLDLPFGTAGAPAQAPAAKP